jgi:cytochrome c nitrite reductase small subunit
VSAALLAVLQAPDPTHGPASGGAPDLVAIAAILAAVVLLVLVEFVYRRRLAAGAHRWLLLLALLVLPAFALLGATRSVFETMKTVDACNSCHVMSPFVDDMRDPASASLAARHFRSGADPARQCYACHTAYAIFGTRGAKRDGFRHWLLYVTRRWEEPLTLEGAYPNADCAACHAGTPVFRAVESHRAQGAEPEGDRMSCLTCHAVPHPLRSSRDGPTARAEEDRG